MIFVHGDTHGYAKAFKRINNQLHFAEATEDDTLIILGDVGANYWGDKRDIYTKRLIRNMRPTVLCLQGNHEQRPRAIPTYKYTYNPRYKCYGWYEPEFPNIFFPEDGAVYIEDKRFLFAGGAYSVDKEYRLRTGAKWFSDEQPSEEDKRRVRAAVCLNNKFDYVCSHTAPLNYEPTHLFMTYVDQSTVDKSTEIYLQEIYEKLDQNYLKQWLFGHYHADEKLNNKFRILFNDMILLD